MDQAGHDAVAAAALKTKQLFDQGQYAASTSQWGTTEYVIMDKTANVDFYNILKLIPSRSRSMIFSNSFPFTLKCFSTNIAIFRSERTHS